MALLVTCMLIVASVGVGWCFVCGGRSRSFVSGCLVATIAIVGGSLVSSVVRRWLIGMLLVGLGLVDGLCHVG